jgi:indolepyruvate ferredoxin oxidoreductase beta subunit
MKAVNMVMVGAASAFLPLKSETLENAIVDAFASREGAAEVNIRAYKNGRNAAANQPYPAAERGRG